nr:D-alanine--D-alanine ligase [Zygnema circumcarinatum]WEL36346.1 D-alanine--D-alanine ligase [Zygnema circumcarinatum]
MLTAYAAATLRTTLDLSATHANALMLQPNTELPQKSCFLVETLVEQGNAPHFLEVPGGLLTHLDAQRHRTDERVTPSEILVTGEVLCLEQKCLAGEGQNITPARLNPNPVINQQIAANGKQDLEKVPQLLDYEQRSVCEDLQCFAY